MFSTTTPDGVRNTYLTLTLFQTLAASFIWGVNTLFLLDAGLSNAEAFGANAFYTAGQMVFEIPTGVVADSVGRRASFLLGAVSLTVSTLLYLLMWDIQAPFWAWAAASAFIGLGYSFFSGAIEAWLVDALDGTGYTGDLETVMSTGQVVAGASMLIGSVAGGYLAQVSNLGVPYIVRSGFLAVTLAFAWFAMRDIGFSPAKRESVAAEMKSITRASLTHGLGNRPVRWLMLAAPFTAGVGGYAFYAMQPYLLELYGDPEAYGIAGLAAAIVAGAQIVGGLTVPLIRKVFARRTHIVIVGAITSTLVMLGLGLTNTFALAVALLVAWAVVGSAVRPVRSAYINRLIPSQQRATVLSFDALMGSAGGVAAQPALGRVADVNGYAASYLVAASVQALAIPFGFLARSENAPADSIENSGAA